MLVTAELIYVHADPISREASPVPNTMRERIRAFETVTPEQVMHAN